MVNRYQNFGPVLQELGYDVTPVEGKRPIVSRWSERPEEASQWEKYATSGVGVVLGGKHNLVAVDIDVLTPQISVEIESIVTEELGDAPRRVGQAPKTLLVFRCTEPFVKHKTQDFEIDGSKNAVEILSEGQQFVASGIHPDTGSPYEWTYDRLIDIEAEQLTVVTPQQLHTVIEQSQRVLEREGKPLGIKPTQTQPWSGLYLKDLTGERQDMEAAIDKADNPDHDYDTWVRALHAIKGALGEDGYDLAHKFSAKSEKYDVSETDRVWHSIKHVHSIGAGSVNYLAGLSPQFDGPQKTETSSDLVRASDITGPIPEREWLLRDWFPAKAVSLLFGPGGVGKTLLVQQLANCVAKGEQFLGIETRKMPVLAVLCEDDMLEISRRQLAINEWLGVFEPMGRGPDNLYIWPRVGEDNVLVTFPNQGVDHAGEFYGVLCENVQRVQQETGSDEILIVLDTAADMFGGNENIRREVNTFLKTYLGSFCTQYNASVITLAHPSLSGLSSGTGMSGSTAWENSARARAYFHRNEDDDDVRILSRKKSNYSAIGDSHDITLLWSRGVYTLPTAPDEVDRIENNTTKNLILQEVKKAFANGVGYKSRGARSFKSALPAAISVKPTLAIRVFKQLEAEGQIAMTRHGGYDVVNND